PDPQIDPQSPDQQQQAPDAPADVAPPPAMPPAQTIRPDVAPPPAAPGLTIPQGTVVTVRTNQALSSDHNHAGDVFSATLQQPLIVRGIVVAQAGQAVTGRVVEAKRAGMVSGVSHLGVQLTALTAADGQIVPIDSQLLVQKGNTSHGRDAAAIAGTTAFG